MIDIGKLYCNTSSTGDSIRYGTHGSKDSHGNSPHLTPKSAHERRPIVVWNITRTCNLKCIHCYTNSENKKYNNELSTKEGKLLIDNLADFKIPSLLFSGGEPFMRPDLFELIEYAAKKNIRPVISTNGTLIDKTTAQKIKDTGVTYVGISLDGIEETNDKFRGHIGAFKKTMSGFDNLRAIDQRVGLRLTLTKHNYLDLNNIFNFIDSEKINRACFYHLVYSGRGENISKDDLSHEETRDAMDIILKRTKQFKDENKDVNILTVDNHVDGVYLYLNLKQQNDPRAEEVYKMLQWNGGGAYSTGVGIGNIDSEGYVHPDQFWQDYSFGNIRERNFSDIWMDESDSLMHGLKHKADYITGKCKDCKYKSLCNGAMRVRAFRMYNDPWAPDPQCYLTAEEIAR